jgi:hypothetical protein
VCQYRQQNRVRYVSEERKKIKKKHSNIRYKKEHFYLLNNVVSEYTWDYSLLCSRLFIHSFFLSLYICQLGTCFSTLVLLRILPVVFSWFIP